MKIELTGFNALAKKLDYLGGDSKSVMMSGLRKGAMKIQADAKRNVKQNISMYGGGNKSENSTSVPTGKLMQSIALEDLPNGVAVGTNVKYAPYVEYGTGTLGDSSVPHTSKPFWRYQDAGGNWHTTHGQRPKPFLRPAFESNVQYVKDAVRNEFMHAIYAQFADD